jgi:hypothetical protein
MGVEGRGERRKVEGTRAKTRIGWRAKAFRLKEEGCWSIECKARVGRRC